MHRRGAVADGVPGMSGRPRVVVVGGGLAGLAAALRCADGGAEVTVLESRPRLGGLTWSFDRGGLTFDNGQHVYLRCCDQYIAFLDRIGSAGLAPLQPRLALPVVRPGGCTGWIRSGRLPAPLHLAGSLLRYPHLSLVERLLAGRAVLGLRAARLDDAGLDGEAFGAWLARHGQRPGAVEALWDLITLPTVNLHAGDASAALGAKVFQTGLLTAKAAADIGWARVPLGRLHGEPAAAALAAAGADVRLRAKVTSVEAVDGAAAGVVVDGERVEADAVVLAVPHDVAASLAPAAAGDTAAWRHLGFSPIVDVHVVYDRRVTRHEIAAGLGSPAQFVFDRTEASGLAAREADRPAAERGQCLAVSISAADAYLGRRPEELIGIVTSALGDLFPAARSAKVVDAVVTRERQATFRGGPGSRRLRPPARTGVQGLFLAGAWTDTGWPATMEGAVRSGNDAAALALGSVGHSRRPASHPAEVVA
jgi:squalene-associated FAD-dependent desaturase